MQPTDDQQRVAAFWARLALRPDAERVRDALARAFILHAGEIWPYGEPDATPQWIAGNVDAMLATLERLYAHAASGEHPGAGEFLDRMSWLPPLLAGLERGARLDG